MNTLRRNPASVAPASEHPRLRGHAFVTAGIVLLAAGCVVVGCALPGDSGPRDVGSMAYPAPLAQGTVATTSTSGRTPSDTGSMAYPTPLPQGTVATTTVR